MTMGPDGIVYVANGPENDAVFRYTFPAGTLLGNFILGGGVSSIKDIEFGPDGDLYMIDNGEIKQFDAVTGRSIRKVGTWNFTPVSTDFRFEPNTGDIIIQNSSLFLHR